MSRSGRVVRAAGGFYDVALGDEVVRCTMRGRLKRDKRRTDLCVVGDMVEVEREQRGDEEIFTLESIAPRTSVFSRRHPGKGGQHKEDVLVANLEQLLVVFAYGDPPLRPRLVDRFLVIAERNGIDAILVANKADQREGDALYEQWSGLPYRQLECSAVSGVGIDALEGLLASKVSALVGPSGVGKSSLLNALAPELDMRVGATNESHGKGRHTTRVASLHAVAGGYIADTPGIRELGAWALDPSELDECFVEMRPLLGMCQFGDCRHDHEPGCAVKAAVGDTISEARYDSYLRLLAG